MLTHMKSDATRGLVPVVLSFVLLLSMYGQTATAGASFGQSFSKWLRKYCDQHCSDDNKVVAAANEFVAHHRDFMPSPDNAHVVAMYIEANKLDPRDGKSYEKAYKDLKKEGQLELYSK